MRAGIAPSFTDLESRRRVRGSVEAHAVQVRLADVEGEVALRVRGGSGSGRSMRRHGGNEEGQRAPRASESAVLPADAVTRMDPSGFLLLNVRGNGHGLLLLIRKNHIVVANLYPRRCDAIPLPLPLRLPPSLHRGHPSRLLLFHTVSPLRPVSSVRCFRFTQLVLRGGESSNAQGN